MILFKNVYKDFDKSDFRLQGINLHIRKGEFVFVTGTTGAGKSSLLRLIYMEDLPTRGEVIVSDCSSESMREKQIPYLRRKLGIVFQDFRLLPSRTAAENVAFALEVIGTPRRRIKTRVIKVLSQVGLDRKADSYPAELSGGEQQRVAIARALVNEPFVLLADEPTGNLDGDTSHDILDLLRNINSMGTAVIMATHDEDLYRNGRHRIVTLHEGKLVKDTLMKVG